MAKHWKRGQDDKPKADCEFSRPEVCVTKPEVETRVEKRTVLVHEKKCAPAQAPGQQPAAISITPADACITVEQVSNTEFQIGLAGCGEGVDYSGCGIEIEAGKVMQFVPPIMDVKSTDGTVSVTKTGCEVNLSISTTNIALPMRVLCAEGPCQEAGKAIGIVQIVKIPAGYKLVGCALAGEGATNAVLAFNTATFSALNDAINAMNSATLDATFGSCGGGGP